MKKTINQMKTIMNHMLCRMLMLAALLGTASSCADFLDIDPHGEARVQDFFKDPSQARQSVFGAYEQLASKQLYGDRMFDYFHMDTDECRMSGSDLRNDWRNICVYFVATSNPYLRDLYANLYKLVNRANDPIDNIPLMDIWVNEGGWDAEEPSDDLKTLRRLYAEAIFLRAIAYNDLINFFGDVPAKFDVSKETDDLTYDLPRENRDLIYDRIISEMEKYVEWLPWVNETALEERITQGAARGLLSRIALRAAGKHVYWNPETYDPNSVYEGDRDKQAEKLGVAYAYSVEDLYKIAQIQCQTVIQKGVHQLNPNFKQLWVDLLNSVLPDATNFERMFEVGIYKVEDGGGVNGTYNSPKLAWNSDLPYGEGKGYSMIMPNYFAHFNHADTRMMITCWPIEMGDNGMINKNQNITKLYLGKFRRWWITTPYKSRLNTDANWCMLRYSDVLLMFAEATWWLDGGRASEDATTSNAEAVEAFNKVRRRAFRIGQTEILKDKDGKDSSAVVIWPAEVNEVTSISFKDIMYERWFEFGGENIRKWDLFRWGKMKERLDQSRKDMANLYFGGNPDNIPVEWKSSDYTPGTMVAPYNQTFIDSQGKRPYRYYWVQPSTEQGVEPEIFFTEEKSGLTRANFIGWGTNPDNSSYYTSYLSDINLLNESNKRGVARFYKNPLKRSLLPLPQYILDNSRNAKQSPFMQLPD